MDLDEMRAKWAEYDSKIEANLRLNRQILNATQLNRAQSALQRLALSLALEAIIQFAVIVALGSFIYDNRAQARFALPAAALDVFAIMLLNVLIRQIVLALQMDYGKPIATIQKQVETLRMLRIRSTRWILMVAPLAWTPLLIVGLKGLFGQDAYKLFGGVYLSANLLFGLVFLLLAIWLSKRFAYRMRRWPVLQGLMRTLAGHNLNAAAGFLATLSEFEDEK